MWLTDERRPQRRPDQSRVESVCASGQGVLNVGTPWSGGPGEGENRCEARGSKNRLCAGQDVTMHPPEEARRRAPSLS